LGSQFLAVQARRLGVKERSLITPPPVLVKSVIFFADGTEPGSFFVIFQLSFEVLVYVFPGADNPVRDTGLVTSGQKPGAGSFLVVTEPLFQLDSEAEVMLRVA